MKNHGSDTPATVFHLPPDLFYDCIRCGRSCGEFSEIRLDPEEAGRIQALPRESLGQARNSAQPVVESPLTAGVLVMRLEGGACCLQTSQGLCSIHAVFGLGAKPITCQSFPYRFVETPAGVFAGLSFVCTAVLRKMGPAVTGQQAALEKLFGFTHNRRIVKEPLCLAGDIPLSWNQYEAIERDLDALFDPALGHIGRRLVMQAIYLKLLITFLRQAREQAGAMAAGAEANDEPLAVFHRRMRGPGPEPWPLLSSLAGKRRPSPLLRRMALGFAHALFNVRGRRRGRLRSYMMFANIYLRQATGRGMLDLPCLNRPIPYKAFRGVRFDPSRPEIDELLTRYFRHCLFRKDLLMKESIQFAHSMQLIQWGLLHWYGAAMAAGQGAGEIQLDHLVESVRNVEKIFVFHTSMDHLFRGYPLLRGFLDRLFDNPLYIFSLGYWENDE